MNRWRDQQACWKGAGRLDRRRRARTTFARRGYLLLESLIATTLLVLGLAVIGTQVQNAHFDTLKMERRTRALMLAESKLAELDTGLIRFDSYDEEVEEEFGPLFPYFAYRIRIQPTVMEGLNQVRLQILFQLRDYDREAFDFDNAEVLHQLYTFRMKPRPVDMEIDFGMDVEQVDQLNEMFTGAGVDLDLYDFDMTEFFRSADIQDLLSLLSNEEIMNSLGIRREQLLQSLPPEVVRALRDLENGETDGLGLDSDGLNGP